MGEVIASLARATARSASRSRRAGTAWPRRPRDSSRAPQPWRTAKCACASLSKRRRLALARRALGRRALSRRGSVACTSVFCTTRLRGRVGKNVPGPANRASTSARYATALPALTARHGTRVRRRAGFATRRSVPRLICTIAKRILLPRRGAPRRQHGMAPRAAERARLLQPPRTKVLARSAKVGTTTAGIAAPQSASGARAGSRRRRGTPVAAGRTVAEPRPVRARGRPFCRVDCSVRRRIREQTVPCRAGGRWRPDLSSRALRAREGRTNACRWASPTRSDPMNLHSMLPHRVGQARRRGVRRPRSELARVRRAIACRRAFPPRRVLSESRSYPRSRAGQARPGSCPPAAPCARECSQAGLQASRCSAQVSARRASMPRCSGGRRRRAG